MNSLLVRHGAISILVFSLIGALSSIALAKGSSTANLSVTVLDHAGEPLEHAVVSLHSGEPVMADPSVVTIMDQRQLQFSPTVVAIQAGTNVSFPNQDDVRHHVYSFSHPNAFELKLYHGEEGQFHRFMHPGVVVLGCNIHDGMVGYLRVVDTPFFANSDSSGNLLIGDVVPGTYKVQIWHPDLGMQPIEKSLTLKAGSFNTQISLNVLDRTPIEPKVTHPLQSLFRD